MSRRVVYLALVALGILLAYSGWQDGNGGNVAWGIAAVIVGGLLAIFDGRGTA